MQIERTNNGTTYNNGKMKKQSKNKGMKYAISFKIFRQCFFIILFEILIHSFVFKNSFSIKINFTSKYLNENKIKPANDKIHKITKGKTNKKLFCKQLKKDERTAKIKGGKKAVIKHTAIVKNILILTK